MMMHGKKGNNLIIIENGQLRTYCLDDKGTWELGRPTRENNPDIKLHSATVSRRHGKFQNMNGIWFYLDYSGKNGTVFNHKHISKGLHGRIKPIMLKSGDVFVFGGADEEIINSKTIWGMFSEVEYTDSWKVVDSQYMKEIHFLSDGNETIIIDPAKGTVIDKENGIAVYMGSLTYVNGDMKVMGF